MKIRIPRQPLNLAGDVEAKPFLRVVTAADDQLVLERAAFEDFPDVPGVHNALTGQPAKKISLIVNIEDDGPNHLLVDVRTIQVSDPKWVLE